MRTLLTFWVKKLLLLCPLLFLPTLVFGKDFVIHDGIVDERAVEKIEEMGSELFQKSGIKVILIAKSTHDENIVAFEQNFAKNLTEPYVLLTLFQKEQKVDVFNSEGMDKLFDKETVLSPLPWKGTIIPLLASKKKEVGVSPALLNGYADIVEQIAESKKIVLQSAIGSANKSTINFIRLGVYGFLGVLIVLFVIRRIRKHD